MTYVYPALKSKYRSYVKGNDIIARRKFGNSGITGMKSLAEYEPKSQDMVDCLDYYKRFEPVGNNACIVNKICWLFEDEFDGYLSKKYVQPQFDCSILKSDATYSRSTFTAISKVYREYMQIVERFMQRARNERIDEFSNSIKRWILVQSFKMECEQICPNEDELCNIVIDLCYSSEKSKQFAWDICGKKIIQNLLEKSRESHYPLKVSEYGDFKYCGEQFIMKKKELSDIDDYFE